MHEQIDMAEGAIFALTFHTENKRLPLYMSHFPYKREGEGTFTSKKKSHAKASLRLSSDDSEALYMGLFLIV